MALNGEQESPQVEWAPDSVPITVCMICQREYTGTETRCSNCQVELSLVHRCPRCSRLVSAKHLRCPFCSKSFVAGDLLDDVADRPAEVGRPPDFNIAEARRQRKHRIAAIFGSLVFVVLFALSSIFLYYHNADVLEPKVMGRSYVLKASALRGSNDHTAPTLAKLNAAEIVEIKAIKRDDRGIAWFEIDHNGMSGYLPTNAVAPPKGIDAASGYLLLKTSLIQLDDPEEITDGAQAVGLFRRLYPSDRNGNELLWLLAEKSRELAPHSSRPSQAWEEARRAYEKLAAGGGDYADQSKALLPSLPSASSLKVLGSSETRRTAAPLQMTGGNFTRSTARENSSRKFLLLDRAEVHVQLSAASGSKMEQIIAGRVATNVVTNGEIAVPAGSICSLRATRQEQGSSNVQIQLLTLDVGGRNYNVDATPVVVRADKDNVWALTRPLLFRLRRTLMIAQ